MNQRGPVHEREGDWNWIDWGNNIDRSVIYNAWYAIALSGAALMAEALGHEKDAVEYLEVKEILARSFNKQIRTDSGYCSPWDSGPVDDRANGLAVLAGFPDASRWGTIRTVLTHDLCIHSILQGRVNDPDGITRW